MCRDARKKLFRVLARAPIFCYKTFLPDIVFFIESWYIINISNLIWRDFYDSGSSMGLCYWHD